MSQQTIPVYKEGHPLAGQKLQGADLTAWRAEQNEKRVNHTRTPLQMAEAARQAAEEAVALVEQAEQRAERAEQKVAALEARERQLEARQRQRQAQVQAESPIMQQVSSGGANPWANDPDQDPRMLAVMTDVSLSDAEAMRRIAMVRKDIAKERHNAQRDQERHDAVLWETISGDLLTEEQTPRQASTVEHRWSDFPDHSPAQQTTQKRYVPPWQAAREAAQPRADQGFWREEVLP